LADFVSRFDLHPHTEFWTQSNQGLGLDWVTRYESQLPLLRQRRQQQHALHRGKRFANALPDARAEGKVSELGSPQPGFGGETFGIEAQRIGKKTGVTMGDELAHQNRCFCGQEKIS
jgi:hypothetical protein